MPRVLWCQGCLQSHLIRDELAGCRVCCDCGLIHMVPSDASSVPAPTGLLDRPVVQVGSVGLLFVSVMVLGGVIAWIFGVDTPQDPSRLPPVASQSTKKTGKLLTTKKQRDAPPPPSTEKQRDPPPPPVGANPEEQKLLALLQQLKAFDLGTNKKAAERLAELPDAIARRAIPAVVAAAERHNNDDFRKLAAEELKRLGPPLDKKDYGCLKDALQIPHVALAQYAVLALKELGEDKVRAAMDAVVVALRHRDPDVSREAFAIVKNLGATAQAPALALLLNPSGDAEEEASLHVLKTLIDEAPLKEDEIDVFAEVLRDGKMRANVRCFTVEEMGKSKYAARAVPALLDVLRKQDDAKLLSLSTLALGRIGDKKKEVLNQLQNVAETAAEERNRLESLQVLEKLDSSAPSTDWIVQRWPVEKSTSVREQLEQTLQSRVNGLKREQLKDHLPPLLRGTNVRMVLIGLNAVKDRKEEAAGVAADVAKLLKNENATVRAAAVNALKALGSAGAKLGTSPFELVESWRKEDDPDVRKALSELLTSRLKALNREQLKTDLRPLLGDKDAGIVLTALEVVEARKEDAADVAPDVADLLTHKDPTVRAEAINSLMAMDAVLEEALPTLPQRLLSLLSDENPAIRRVGLNIVQVRKTRAAGAADAVVLLLYDKKEANVRKAAVNALQALGSAAEEKWPRLFQLVELWRDEEVPAVKQAFADLMTSRLATLNQAKMKDQLPALLTDKDARIVLMGLNAVKARKEKKEAADVAPKLAELVTHGDATVRAETLNVLNALGSNASKAIPKLFEILEVTRNKYQSAPLALLVARIIESNDSHNADLLLPYLVNCLHPKALGAAQEADIKQAIQKFGERSVNKILAALDTNLKDEHPGTKDNAEYRKKLYAILAELGRKYASQANFDEVRRLRSKETKLKFNNDVIEAAGEALRAMDDR